MPTIEAVISEMSPDKANEFTAILAVWRGDELKRQLANLYDKDDSQYAAYRAFLANHSITFLAGNNSRNFKITDLNTGHVKVLKIENRLTNGVGAENHLRTTEAGDVLTPIFAEKPVAYGGRNLRLLVTEYHDAQDLSEYMMTLRDDTDREAHAIVKLLQVVNLLEVIQSENCAFPDLKASNLLLDNRGHIKVSDGKSLVPTNKEGIINEDELKASGHVLLFSESYSPIELAYETRTPSIDAEKMHVYLLGAALRSVVLGMEPMTELVDHMMAKAPEDRPSLKTVKAELQSMEAEYVAIIQARTMSHLNMMRHKNIHEDELDTYKEIVLSTSSLSVLLELEEQARDILDRHLIKSDFEAALEQLNQYKLDEFDTGAIASFIEQRVQALGDDPTYEDYKAQIQRVKAVIEKVSPYTQVLKQTLGEIKESAYPEMQEHILELEDMIRNIPFDKRSEIPQAVIQKLELLDQLREQLELKHGVSDMRGEAPDNSDDYTPSNGNGINPNR